MPVVPWMRCWETSSRTADVGVGGCHVERETGALEGGGERRNEAALEVAVEAFDLACGLRPIGPAGLGSKTELIGERGQCRMRPVLALAVGIGLDHDRASAMEKHLLGDATEVDEGLEQALIARFGTLRRVHHPFLLRSDNGLVFTSRGYPKLIGSHGFKQEFITPHTPQQNGFIEGLICTLTDPCLHPHRFGTVQHASRVLATESTFTTPGVHTKRSG